MKSILVIGVGRFGHHLVNRLIELDNKVMVVDKEEDSIETCFRLLRQRESVIVPILMF